MDTTTTNRATPLRPADAPAPDMPDWWEIEDVARYFKVGRRTVMRMNIPYAKIGRRRLYLRQDIAKYFLAKVS